MPITKTINFLPTVFQSETNQKFLNATLDQLVTEPNLVAINGYVGRKFAPGFSGIGTYIQEPTADRADYQLEPSIVVKNADTDEVEFYTTYPEVLQKINYYGGKTDNQNPLWGSEYYSYNPRINADAFINFGQYYWLPNGPDPVQVFAGAADLERSFYVYPDNNVNVYNISGYNTSPNPGLVLARGGNYKFEINQPGKKFWIQTEPGLSGISVSTNLSTRQILGVTNNGTDNGTVSFNVPLAISQDFYIDMPEVGTIDFVFKYSYADIQGKLLSDILREYNGIDGQRTNLNGKTLIFGAYSDNTADWTYNSVVVPDSERYGIWQINLIPAGADYIVSLAPTDPIPVNNKVLVLSGIEFGNTQWYTTAEYILGMVPVITAPLDTLYYQDSEDASQYGVIRLVDPSNNVIAVATEILGKTNYTSPNGVTFTNGLKIQFDTGVTPDKYKNNQYYVEGVGTGIKLVSVDALVINAAQSKPGYNPDSYYVACANATLNQSRDVLTVTTNDFPTAGNINVGTFPNTDNSSSIVLQDFKFEFPYRAGQNLPGEHESLLYSENIIGVTLPGIVINGVSNGAFVPGINGTKWHYDINQALINGQDAYGGQVVVDGVYAYTNGNFINANAWGNVSGFTTGYNDITTGHSKLIGFAADGYPIYGPYGYANPTSPSSPITKMVSSYNASNDGLDRPEPQTVTATVDTVNDNYITVTTTYGLNPGMRITFNNAGIPYGTAWIVDNGLKTAEGLAEFDGSVGQVKLNTNVNVVAGSSLTFEFLPGAFIEDYSYVENSGTLDQYNGRYCVTPDFPLGTYAYFITETTSGSPAYPYVVGPNFFGSVNIDTNTSLLNQDYIVISRASIDLNPWTRRNRWFHKNVIELTASYNNAVQVLDADARAKRPIIEFDSNMQLLNFGKRAKAPIDLLDTTTTNPLLSVEGTQGIYIDGINVIEGMRVVFAADQDPLTRGTIWVITFVDVVGISSTDPKIIKLVKAADGTVLADDTVSVFNGVVNNGKSFWYDGINWLEGQQKKSTNQPPLFDVFDKDGDSFADIAKYPIINNQTKFAGTKIFSYTLGTGVNDPVLGFPLAYKNFNNVGDIQFTNNFDTEAFDYGIDNVTYTAQINSGFLYKNNEDGTTSAINVWTGVNNDSLQMQDIAYTYDGINNSFIVDVIPNPPTTSPTLTVYVNAKKLSTADFQTYNIPDDRLLLTVNQTKIKSGDRIDILVYSDTVSKIGYYQIPENLNLNAQNNVLTNTTLGELRNHIGQLSQNNLNFEGQYPGVSNLRDLYVSNEPGLMLQQSAPVTYASMFLSSEEYSFVDSMLYAQQEYTRFKNKFLNIASTSANIPQTNPPAACDYIIKQINSVKNKSFPWYYSGMVPYGDNKNVIQYTIFNPLQRNYEITTQFNNNVVSNQAILVYLNGVQLVYEREYAFLTTGPGLTILDSVTLTANDILTIVEYANTDGNWIPETPSKLGLYPKYTPVIYVDNTYSTPQTMIRGHDGSLTPAFGDFRDQVLLELEKRIYNNIKVEYSDKLVNIYDSIPGKFRDTGYSITEYNNLLSRIYLQWVGNNKLDYVTNDTFSSGYPFTYNYANSQDVIDGSNLPGSWRACFQYFYDTQRPNTAPWEMLGFSEQPDWWVDTYGPAPYTGGNEILWTDLENGYIANGPRKGVDSKFARPGLSNIIPVDEFGNLRAPIGLLTTKYDQNTFDRNWNIGQFSPTETAWRNSSEYPYAVQYAAAMIQPAKYFAYGIQTDKYRYDTELSQYLIVGTNNRITPADVVVNGYVDTAGNISRATGYLNWISDFQVGKGITDKAPLTHFVQDYTVQLAYRMAGYSGKQYLKILAEQNSPNSTNDTIIIPDSNFDIVLGKSTPLLNARYSAIIIERTDTGYKLSGYDLAHPYITIIPPMTTGNGDIIRVLNDSVTYYTEFVNYKVSIPYGTELTSLQQVANLLAGYERFLISQGFRFDYFDQTLGQIRDWALSTREFLFWNQQSWATSSTIVLGPCANNIKLINPVATVDGISNNFYGSKVTNQNGQVLTEADYNVGRDNNTFRLNLVNQNDLIGFLELHLVQYEHVAIFDNKTQFNDVIYDPVMGQRQFRLKFVGSKTGGWTGTLSAQGFMYNQPGVQTWRMNKDYLKGDLVEYKSFYYAASKDIPGTPDFNFANWLPVDKNKVKTGLLNNFARNAQIGETFYNVDRVNLESDFDQFALSLIGYKNRAYLNELGLDDVSQVKFYQGFIREKGTLNAINALGHVTFTGTPSDVTVSEDWAFRVGSYGSLETNQSVDITLDESYTLNNPTSVQVLSNNSVSYGSLYTDPAGVYKTSVVPWSAPFLLNRTNDSNYGNDIQVAGYVDIDDIDFTVFDLTDISTLNTDITNIGTGDLIWVAKDYQQSWNVYRVSESTVSVVSVTNALNGQITLKTDKSHGLSVDDTILVAGIDRFTGFYRVRSVSSLTTFVVDYAGNLTGFSTQSVSGPLFSLISMIVDRPVDITSLMSSNTWSTNNKVWVNYANSSDEWAVYNKTEPWTLTTSLPKATLEANSQFGSAVRLSYDNKFAVAGIPGYNGNVGAITNYVVNFDNQLIEDITITSLANNTTRLGDTVDSGTSYVLAGAPASNGDAGYVFVYYRGAFGSIADNQILAPNAAPAGRFGQSIAVSKDDRWLYIGAPENDTVYVYALDVSMPVANVTLTADGFTSTYALPFVPAAEESILVRSATQTFVPFVDYTLSGASITFADAPSAGAVVINQTYGYMPYTTLVGNAGSKFGFSLAATLDGAQVVIGAPEDNAAAGTITVYDRSIENYIATDGQVYFSGTVPVTTYTRVYVNGVEKFFGTDWIIFAVNWVQFLVPVEQSSIVTVETNVFRPIGTEQPVIPYTGQKFGYSVDICPNNCSIYVGAPYQSEVNLYNGAVYRFINQGKAYGSIIGQSPNGPNPTVNSGDSIRINDFVVNFVDTTLSSAITAINNVNIPGVKASNVSGNIQIVCDSTVIANKLRILPGVGSAIADLGLDVFVEVDVINNSLTKSYDYFGKKVKINENSNILVVASDEASTIEITTFDASLTGTTAPTVFDAGSTMFAEPVDQSGAVWIYSYLPDGRASIEYPGKFAFVQQLTPTTTGSGLKTNDKFGSDIDINDFELLIGSKDNKQLGYNTGKIYQFNNLESLLGWDPYRVQEPRVDINSIIKGYIYSASTQTISYNLDFIDPAKGKILGLAEQDISYKIDYDPAIYNYTSIEDLSSNNTLYWSTQYVGQVWWDLSTVKYMLYEQGSIRYRTANWGRTFPGSSIDVYEWVESNYPPSQYVANGGNGVPKYPNNEAFVTLNYVDPVTNYTTVKYYFWVKDKSTISVNQFGRTIPTTTIASYIRDPKNSGVKFFAPIRNDAVSIYNMVGLTTGKDTIFHLDYATKLNSNTIHSEFALLSDKNSKSASIPQNIYNKLVDSVAGIDVFGNPVPDPTLPLQNRYGIDIRPRQSMFVDRNSAVKEMVIYANSVFAKNVISQGFDLTALSEGEPIPAPNSGAYDLVVANLEELSFVNTEIVPVGYKVLVTADSSVSNLWTIYIKDRESVVWEPNTFYKKNTTIIHIDGNYIADSDFTSGEEFDVTYLNIYVVRNVWVLIQVQAYATNEYWNYVDWYAAGIDRSVIPTYTVNTSADISSLQLRAQDTVKVLNNGQGKWFIIQVYPNITNTIAIQDGTIQLKDNLYNLPDYGLGFDAGGFDMTRFDQNPSIETRKILEALRNDLFINELDPAFLELFFVFVHYALNEQKFVDWTFKTSFINVLQKVKGLTQPSIYTKENQDFYLQYINEVKPYKTTVREYVVDYEGNDNYYGYVTDFDVPPYYDPVLGVYRSPSGEFIEDAKALELPQYRDWISNYTYSIASIEVLDGGSGYTLPPVVTITGSTIGNDAVARALITNGVVTKIIVLYQGSNYTSTPVVSIIGGNGEGAIARANLQNKLIRNIKTTMAYNRITYGTDVVEWTPNTVLERGTIVAYSGVAYVVNQTYNTGLKFSNENLTVYPVTKLLTANDRITAYYQPELGQPGKDFSLLETGITYPGVELDGPMFSDSGGFDVASFDSVPFDSLEINEDGTYVISDKILDSVITGNFTDTSLGIRPEDIIVDGGPYVYDTFREWTPNTYYDKGDIISFADRFWYTVQVFTSTDSFDVTNLTIYNIGPYASHAPEELIPGRVFDTLDIKIYTIAADMQDPTVAGWQYFQGAIVDYIYVINPGAGYEAGNVGLMIESANCVTQASGQVTFNANGEAVSFEVINHGAGFRETPTVTVIGANTVPVTAGVVMKLSNAPYSVNPYPSMAYRIFKDMNDNYTYLRLDSSASTTLVANVAVNDAVIYVDDVTKLPEPAPAGAEPGVVFINGERISYYQKDIANNAITQLRRGTAGTGANVHYAGNTVVDGSFNQIVYDSSNYTYTPNANVSVTCTDGNVRTLQGNVTYIQSNLWYSLGTSTATNGAGLFVANTLPASFIREGLWQ